MAHSYIKSKNPTKPVGYRPKDTKLTPEFREFRTCTDPKRRKVLRDKLALSNYPLACKVAKRFRAQWSLDSVPIEDLIQSAMIGILKAIDLYDPDIAAFSGFGGMYALWQCQTAAIAEGHIARAPAKSDVLKRLKDFRILKGREPNAEELGVSDEIHKAIYEPKVQVCGLENCAGVPDDHGYDHDDNIANEDLDPEVMAIVLETLNALPEKEQELYQLHFIWGMTPRQIAKEIGVKAKDVEVLLEGLVKALRDGLASD